MGVYYDVKNLTRRQHVTTENKGYPPGIKIIAKVFGWDIENDWIISHGDYDIYRWVDGHWTDVTYEWEQDCKDGYIAEGEKPLFINDVGLDEFRDGKGYLTLSDPSYGSKFSKTTKTNILLHLEDNCPLKYRLAVDRYGQTIREYEIDDPMTKEEMKSLFERTGSSGERDEPEADAVAGAGVESFTEKEEEEFVLPPLTPCAVCPHCAQPMPTREMEAKPPAAPRPVPKVVKKVVKKTW